MIGPRVRVRVRYGRDDDGCHCESPWQHPIVVALATTVFQVFGELAVRRLVSESVEQAKAGGDE